MTLSEDHKKKFTYATYALYVLGWVFGSDHIILALFSFGGSIVCALGTVPPDAKEQQTQMRIVIAAFILPALGVLWMGYHDSADADKFRNYLSEHRCKNIGLTITGYSEGGCDRFGDCVEPQEIEEPEYSCAATGKHITYSDFKAGHYGQ